MRILSASLGCLSARKGRVTRQETDWRSLVTMPCQERNLRLVRCSRKQESRQPALLCLQPSNGLLEPGDAQQCRIELTRERGGSRLRRREFQPGAIQIDRLAPDDVPRLPQRLNESVIARCAMIGRGGHDGIPRTARRAFCRAATVLRLC
jgi:hypothetical protein